MCLYVYALASAYVRARVFELAGACVRARIYACAIIIFYYYTLYIHAEAVCAFVRGDVCAYVSARMCLRTNMRVCAGAYT